MILLALIVGLLYGYVSVKGQFCMNSGFSNVVRRGDTTKLKSYATAILIQMVILPFLFVFLYSNESTNHFIENISLPPLFLLGSAIGGFLFGVSMYYAAGCGAGIFYKIGERNAGAIFSTLGFIFGIYLTEKWIFRFIKELVQDNYSYSQQPFWKSASPLIFALIITSLAVILLILLLRTDDNKPGGAVWGWKKSGISIGIIAILGWLSAIMVHNPFGIAIIPGALDILDFKYSWGLVFVAGIPLGAFWSSRENKEKRFAIPNHQVALRRLFGGLGLGVSGSITAGCTVGHGLTFAPLLGVGSIVATVFIFFGSGLMGYLTKK